MKHEPARPLSFADEDKCRDVENQVLKILSEGLGTRVCLVRVYGRAPPPNWSLEGVDFRNSSVFYDWHNLRFYYIKIFVIHREWRHTEVCQFLSVSLSVALKLDTEWLMLAPVQIMWMRYVYLFGNLMVLLSESKVILFFRQENLEHSGVRKLSCVDSRMEQLARLLVGR